MFCKKCGSQIEDGAKFCPSCGESVDGVPNSNPSQYRMAPTDSGSIGWGVLGFFFPLVGLILFLVWKDEKPRSSKNAGIGALISVCSGIVLGIVFTIIMAALSIGLGLSI